MADPGSGLWLYAIARRFGLGVLTGMTGVGGGPVSTVAEGDLVAVVSPADLAEFGEAALRRNLEDLDWLSATARTHDAVVASVCQATAAVPVRLATVYLDERGVAAMLAERRPQLHGVLDLVAGRTEWGVKAYADPQRLAATTGRSEAGVAAGTAYLQRRRQQLSARDQAEQVAAKHTEQVHRTLEALAVAALEHPPQDPRLSGRPGWMVLNGAYLVDDDKAEEFAAAVTRLDAQHPEVAVELTGPWPPYSFAATAWEAR